MHNQTANKIDSKLFAILLTPSWLSGLLAIAVGVLLVVGTVGAINYHGSQLQLLVKAQNPLSSVSHNTQAIDTALAGNTLLSDIPLFVFWAGIGMIAYSFTMGVVRAFGSAAEIQEELNYVHSDRRGLIRQVSERVALRLVVLIAWIFFVLFSLHHVLPYALAAAYAATGPVSHLMAASYLLGSTALLAVCLHVHTIMLRLMLLKPRLFGEIYLPGRHA